MEWRAVWTARANAEVNGMKAINIGGSGILASEIALGCMRIQSISSEKAAELVLTALDNGINFFDNADIYAAGESEEIFGNIIKAAAVPRDKIYIQTKCGICDGYFDFSKDHIIEAVNASLKRLGTDYLDVLLLHRPDALMEPEEVAEAFSLLHAAGKVRHFGVSNQKPMQIALLRKYLEWPIIANQLQLSIAHSQMIRHGFEVNMETEGAVDRDGSVLDYCRLYDITIQAWSPFQHGFFAGPFLGSTEYKPLNAMLQEVADTRGVSVTAIAIAWLLRHPAGIQPVVGTMNVTHLNEICQASGIRLTRKEWYDIYVSAGNKLP